MKKFGKVLGIILFLILGVFATLRINHILTWKDDQGIRQFYEYDDNIMDVVAYGSSHTYCTVNTPLLWEKYGMAIYNMGESGQNIGSTYSYIKESFKTQKPKVLLVEVRGLIAIDEGFSNGNLYRNTLGMKYSQEYLDNMEYALGQSAVPEENKDKIKLYLLSKYPISHSRYDELTQFDFEKTDITHGRYKGAWTSEPYDVPNGCTLTKREPLTDEQIYWLDQIVELSREEGVNLVLWIAPYIVRDSQMVLYNSIKDYAAEHDIPFINFNEIYEEIGFDYKTDMRKEKHTGSHLNNYGAEKVTMYLGDYVHEHYDIPDRTGQDGYEIYETIYQNWMQEVKEHEEQQAAGK